MIAPPVVALREIDQLAADARRTGEARQFAHAPGHLPVMIAVGKLRRRFACHHGHRPARDEKLAGGARKRISQGYRDACRSSSPAWLRRSKGPRKQQGTATPWRCR